VSALIFNFIFLLGAWGLEIQSLLIVIKENASERDFLFALTLHFSACVVNALVLPRLLASRYSTPPFITFLLFFVIPFYMPVLGIAVLVFAAAPALSSTKTARKYPIYISKIRTFPETAFSENHHYQSKRVDLEALLKSTDPDKRLSAVYATLKLDDQNAIPLLKMALRDPVDDIRLLSYALIDRKEKRIYERIEHAKRCLDNHEILEARHLYKSIVNDYWELVHAGLVDGENLNYMLDKAKEYLEMGLQRYPDDRGLHLQYAKLLLKLGETELSHKEFKTAEDLGVDQRSLLLYYAEINFLHRRFDDVKRYMKGLNPVAAAPAIRASTRFWQRERIANEPTKG
jgi:hypothetical protein